MFLRGCKGVLGDSSFYIPVSFLDRIVPGISICTPAFKKGTAIAKHSTNKRNVVGQAIGHGCLRHAVGLLPVRVSVGAVAPTFFQKIWCHTADGG